VRGFLERRRYRVLLAISCVYSKYFKKEEAAETLDKINNETNGVHEYRTGARYEGQWNGGMRHGWGIMIWPDGARYEGEWQFNQAYG